MNASTLLAAVADLSPLDRRFASFLVELASEDSPELALAAALASRRVEEGHVCLDLPAVAGRPLASARKGEPPLGCPGLSEWTAALRATSVVGEPGEFTPLVLDSAGRVYLQRYWAYEKAVADFVLSRARAPLEAVDSQALAQSLAQHFPGQVADRQRVAAVAAVHRRFLVISGGPGTGKTSTVVKVLALLLEQPGGEGLRIALAAPTGKAAARLKDSLRSARDALAPRVRDRIPEDVSTVHRLLGPLHGSSRFRHHATNPLPFAVVAVDEASMVDLPLMAKLVAALPAEARLLLLGDRSQLASVQAGAVLGDLCGGGRDGLFSPGLAAALRRFTDCEALVGGADEGLLDSMVFLQHSFRFGSGSGIGCASRAVNEGDARAALEILCEGQHRDASWVSVGSPGGTREDLAARIVEGNRALLCARSPQEAFEAFARFQVLCGLRKGPFGSEAVNALAEEALAAADLARLPRFGPRWYRGRPILVTANDYGLGLFNGDVGIALADPAAGELRVFFPHSEGGFRSLHPTRLPAHETAYAMTVHKSQGSEFEEVLLVLGDHPSPVFTRELVYTGMTRAKSRVEVWGTPEVFHQAVANRTQRSSGLREALWGASSSA